jgi:hypothetical protein
VAVKYEFIPGLSAFDEKRWANILEIDGYACIAVWDWENERNEATSQIISEFRTKWVVPPHPSKQSKQTIFLFNGMQTSARNKNAKAILQPVLEWGNHDQNTGTSWSVASWYVKMTNTDSGMKIDTVARTISVPVKSGDVLCGIIRQSINSEGNAYACTCEFEGIAGSGLVVQSSDEFVQNGLALEVYQISECSELPAIDHTSYTAINLQQGNTRLKPKWNLRNKVSDCNIRAEVTSHDGIEDQVDIRYK